MLSAISDRLKKAGLRLSGFFSHKATPSEIIVIGFMAIIAAGTLLLYLPVSSVSGVKDASFIDALFTSTSAVCVTGLSTLNTATQWSSFGRVVLLILIQLGGIGFMTVVTAIMVLAGRKITLRNRLIIQASFNQTTLDGMVSLVLYVIFGTMLLEGIGIIILTLRFWISYDFAFSEALELGVFHGISAFCSAGFDVIGKNSFAPYVGDGVITLTLASLIETGGIGFVVWAEFVTLFHNRRSAPLIYQRHLFHRLSLHAKIVLVFSSLLVFGGTLFYFFVEYHNPKTFGTLSVVESLWASLFQSVNARTSGFYTVRYGDFSYASQLMSILLMVIGGSPAGTAGGIKTVNFAVITFAVISVIRGRSTIDAFGRRISMETLQKALTVVFLIVSTIVVASMALTLSEAASSYEYRFSDLLLEAASAVTTTGLSAGITPHLSAAGKGILIICMFIGRLGPITVAIALTNKLSHGNSGIQYPEERILIG